MFDLRSITPRVQKLRQRYRETTPSLDAERTRIITDYYRANGNEAPIVRRAKALAEILSHMTVRVEPDELIVGNVGKYFRGCNLWVEYSGLTWLVDELDSGLFDKKAVSDGFMLLDEGDREYLRSVEGFWREHWASAKVDAAMPEGFEVLVTADVLPHGPVGNAFMPHGHFNANYRKVVDKGFGAIKREALEKLDAMQGRISGADAEKYFFYRSIVITCDSAILFSRRYAAECRAQASTMAANRRRAELLRMADSLDWIMENPARTFREAVQGCLLYHVILNIEGSFLGLTIGRIDQHVGDYLEADLAAGRITREEAQEVMDCFFLKMGDLFVSGPVPLTRVIGAYSNNMRMTLAGRKPDGTDATNSATYLCLQSAARLKLHDPTLSLGLHQDSPAELWEAGIETAKIVGGIPTLENADLIIDILHKRGLAIEDARNYCIVGCVESTGSGCEFANPSAPFSKTFLNINNVLLQAINNGVNPRNGKRGGLETGHLYEMESFQQVQDAFRRQLEYFMDWHFSLNNILACIGDQEMPIPLASATMDGCLESGRDITKGGAKYNSTGGATFGVGTLADSLSAIKYMVYDKKLCTGRELYDAILADWKGYELLRRRVMNEVPHYGNGDPYADELASWAIDLFSNRLNSYVGARGGYRAGIYSAGAHVRQGLQTHATPNGRRSGEPVSDGASPSQGADRNGPTGVARSVLALHPHNFGNGLQFCMKFHPTSVRGEEGTEKLRQFVAAFFDEGGMQIQYNVVDSDTLKEAQVRPDDYRDLVVRVAGFSAYFVELCQEIQDDLIKRTEIYA
jgi:pyruvate formate-lyase/glycerol dehydratase family glycyl radical enzyme